MKNIFVSRDKKNTSDPFRISILHLLFIFVNIWIMWIRFCHKMKLGIFSFVVRRNIIVRYILSVELHFKKEYIQ